VTINTILDLLRRVLPTLPRGVPLRPEQLWGALHGADKATVVGAVFGELIDAVQTLRKEGKLVVRYSQECRCDTIEVG
jgi:hypothetical protein